MKKIFFTVCVLAFANLTFAQKISIKRNDLPIEKKMETSLRYEDRFAEAGEEDYQIELFFIGGYWKGYKGYYKLFNKEGSEVYKSKEWSFGGYGGTAENKMVRKVIDKDLPNALKALKKQAI